MKTRLILLSVFNTIDTFSTIYLVQALGLEEANPVCRFLLGISPVLFLAVKLVGFNLVLLYLWRVREHKLAQIGTWVAFVAYGLLVAYHGFIFYLLFRLNLIF